LLNSAFGLNGSADGAACPWGGLRGLGDVQGGRHPVPDLRALVGADDPGALGGPRRAGARAEGPGPGL